MVRLLRVKLVRCLDVALQFQSHNGAIAATARRFVQKLRRLFQSHNGAIAAFMVVERNLTNGRVSIPQWCDCCKKLMLGIASARGVSIPQWCDCCHLTSEVLFCCPVSIPQWCDCCTLPQRCLFTCILVSIPQWCDCCLCSTTHTLAALKCFNPTMVRLLLELKYLLFVPSNVSIPQWCDCCGGWAGGMLAGR